jgi:hypothetical protein
MFSFLPAFSLPYTHYSLVTRSEAPRRRFVERRTGARLVAEAVSPMAFDWRHAAVGDI